MVGCIYYPTDDLDDTIPNSMEYQKYWRVSRDIFNLILEFFYDGSTIPLNQGKL